MVCVSPVWVRRTRMSVPCGKCGYCLQNKRLDWAFRLEMEGRYASSSWFITLTYDEAHLPFQFFEGLARPTLVKAHVQKFIKDLRYRQSLHSTEGLRYYLVGEYGGQRGRPHYHIALFNAAFKTVDELHKVWTKGQIDIGDLTPESCAYVCKYMITRESYGDEVARPFSLMSRRPGIGDAFRVRMFDFYRQYGKPLVPVGNGKYRRLARFYKDKFFTAKEKESWRLQALFHGDELKARALEIVAESFNGDKDAAFRYMEHQVNWHEVYFI